MGIQIFGLLGRDTGLAFKDIALGALGALVTGIPFVASAGHRPS